MQVQLSILLKLLTLLLVFSFACNRVEETPEPDRFASQEMLSLAVEADGGSAYLNVLEQNQITSEVSIRFDSPKNGNISLEADRNRFLYKANTGFNGKEVIQYEVCKTGNCKKGDLSIEVKNNYDGSCRPVFAPGDFPDETIPAFAHGPRSFSLAGPDQYCSENTVTLLNPVVPDYSLQIENDSVVIELHRRYLAPAEVLVNIRVCDKEGSYEYCRDRVRRIRIETPPGYCDDLFEVENRSPLQVPGDTLQVNANTFISLVTTCEGELDPGFFEIQTSSNLGFFKRDGNYFIYRRPGRPGYRFLFYRYRNIRGLIRSGKVNINF